MKRVKRGHQDSDSDDSEDEASQSGPPKKVLTKKANPFFKKDAKKKVDKGEKDEDSDPSDDSDLSDDSDSDDVSSNLDSDDDSDGSGDSDVIKEPATLEDEEDPLIIALKKAKEKHARSAPPDIKFRDRNVMDISFHPSKNLIAASLIDGDMSLFEYSNEVNTLMKKLNIHKSTIRSIEFDRTGQYLCSGSKDKSFKVTDVETSQVVFKCAKAHGASLYKIKPLNENLIATGDEDGTVKLWDNRQKTVEGGPSWTSVMEAKNFEEFVSDIFFAKEVDERIMVAASGEGTLMSYNLRGKKPDMQSEVYDGEFNAMSVVHKNSKLVTGCGNGKLYMFDWKEFCYHSADFKGHPDAINHLVSATDNVIITACEDGAIRAVHLYPHRFIGTVGHHEENFPVERLDISGTGDVLASISHDQKIKFWCLKYLEEIDYDKKPKPFHQRKIKMRRKDNKMRRAQEIEYQLPSSNRGNKKDFFKGLDDEN